MIQVSDPQRLTITERLVRRYVERLRSLELDVHEFATEYANRTVDLGYPPDLGMAVKEFIRERYVCDVLIAS